VGIFLQEIGTFRLLVRRLLVPRISALQIASFLQSMLITATTATTALTLPVFAVLIAISSALALSLGAVLRTLIGQPLKTKKKYWQNKLFL
jgi:hypothetical protein